MQILHDILNNKDERNILIKQFQELIWNGNPGIANHQQEDILRDLAHDLDFYEPNSKLRSEASNFYGDERLELEIKSALIKLQEAK